MRFVDDEQLDVPGKELFEESTFLASVARKPECMASVSMPCAFSLSAWSFIRAINGVTTSVTPGIANAANW